MLLDDINNVAFLLVLRTYRMVRDVTGGGGFVFYVDGEKGKCISYIYVYVPWPFSSRANIVLLYPPPAPQPQTTCYTSSPRRAQGSLWHANSSN